MEQVQHTVFYQSHLDAGARMVDFAGWQMPIQYSDGIVTEHLWTRRHAGLFDVSHMGRFLVSGQAAAAFLRHVLTNDCEHLAVGQAQYTILANEAGGAIDDAFLYKTAQTDYLLVVNASNAKKDFDHLSSYLTQFSGLEFADVSESMAMLALQGPESEAILKKLVSEGNLPNPTRNSVASLKIDDVEVTAARTGYTGEPTCFELFIPNEDAVQLWDRILQAGAKPVGLGARDTLRLEAGLPLYGHELGADPDGGEIPIYAIPQAPFAVSFEDDDRDFIGRDALVRQAQARRRYKAADYTETKALPKIVRQFRLTDKGIAREGAGVYHDGQNIGWVSSGTMVPYWLLETDGEKVQLKEGQDRRAIGLCMVTPQTVIGSEIEIDVRGRLLKAEVVARNLENRNTKITYAL